MLQRISGRQFVQQVAIAAAPVPLVAPADGLPANIDAAEIKRLRALEVFVFLELLRLYKLVQRGRDWDAGFESAICILINSLGWMDRIRHALRRENYIVPGSRLSATRALEQTKTRSAQSA
jgi:hypothetical protein